LVFGVLTVGWSMGGLAFGSRKAGTVLDLGDDVTDVEIIATYNDALFDGWAAGETPTIFYVASSLGTSAEHVRAVIARHWQR